MYMMYLLYYPWQFKHERRRYHFVQSLHWCTDIKQLYDFFICYVLPVRKIIYWLKLVDYLWTQVDKPRYNYFLFAVLCKQWSY